jgi:hypothetical protein
MLRAEMRRRVIACLGKGLLRDSRWEAGGARTSGLAAGVAYGKSDGQRGGQVSVARRGVAEHGERVTFVEPGGPVIDALTARGASCCRSLPRRKTDSRAQLQQAAQLPHGAIGRGEHGEPRGARDRLGRARQAELGERDDVAIAQLLHRASIRDSLVLFNWALMSNWSNAAGIGTRLSCVMLVQTCCRL